MATKNTTTATKTTSSKKASKPAAKTTGNLPLEDARKGVLKVASKGRVGAVTLRKDLVPYGNYAALLAGLEADGLVKVVKNEDDKERFVEITAKGKAEAKK